MAQPETESHGVGCRGRSVQYSHQHHQHSGLFPEDGRITSVYMLGAKHGFAQSADCAAWSALRDDVRSIRNSQCAKYRFASDL